MTRSIAKLPKRLHLLGIPHTLTTPQFSHCAFTAKVLKMAKMMAAQGWEVVHYGNGDTVPAGAHTHHRVLEEELLYDLLGHRHEDARAFVGNDASVDHPAYRVFNARLARLLQQYVLPGEIVALPFGHGHEAGTRHHSGINVETGIGYPVCIEPWRIYESEAWMHWHAAREDRGVRHTEYVIPNYFDVDEWAVNSDSPRSYVAYLGRIIPSKGMDVLWNLARALPDVEFRVAGQGDIRPWALPNVLDVGPLVGRERAQFLGEAFALLAPSQYIEPFCGVTVEANLCGTPALTTSAGAFCETILHGFTGRRGHTLGDWLAGIEWARGLSSEERHEIGKYAAHNYGLATVGKRYDEVFAQIQQSVLSGKGWYTNHVLGNDAPLPPHFENINP